MGELKGIKKLVLPGIMWLFFEIIAVTLWRSQKNLFYLINFSYIGTSVATGVLLFQFHYKHARRVAQLLVGTYMFVYLGLVCNENMQIEGFWYYLFTGVFEAATIHYAVAKIFGPLFFGRGWCGFACWTAMILDLLPYRIPQKPRKKWGFIRYITFVLSSIGWLVTFMGVSISGGFGFSIWLAIGSWEFAEEFVVVCVHSWFSSESLLFIFVPFSKADTQT